MIASWKLDVCKEFITRYPALRSNQALFLRDFIIITINEILKNQKVPYAYPNESHLLLNGLIRIFLFIKNTLQEKEGTTKKYSEDTAAENFQFLKELLINLQQWLGRPEDRELGKLFREHLDAAI